MKEGNNCIYYLKQFFNIFLIFGGFLIISIGSYLWYKTKQFTFVEVTFFILGGVQILLGLFGIDTQYSIQVLSSKKATIRVKLYNYILGVLVLVQITATILGFALKDKVIDEAAKAQGDSQKSIDELKTILEQNVNVALYITFACIGIQLACLLFSVWYANSLESHNENFNLMYDEKEKKYMSFEEYSGKQKNDLDEKAKIKREEVYTRNPEYYEWKQKQEEKKKGNK